MFDVPQLDFSLVRVRYQDTIHDDVREPKQVFLSGFDEGDVETLAEILGVLEGYGGVAPGPGSLADELIAMLNRRP